MCDAGCLIFGAKSLSEEEVKGKRVLEVGSYDVIGSLRPIVESWGPAQYVGVDIEEGPGVDVICSAENIVREFGKESFDIVISTELLEHVRNWKKAISNFKNVCKPNGVILITTRSYGFGYHGYPHDFWRYELEDMENIFSDCRILVLEREHQAYGVFIKVKKPDKFTESDLSDYKLYSIVVNRREREIKDRDFRNFFFMRQVLKKAAKSYILKKGKFIIPGVNVNCIIFGAINLAKEEVQGKRVLEVGSRNITGSLRPIIESFNPEQYVGIDIIEGPGVDVVCSAGNIVREFGKESFDIVISTELLEHVRNWKEVISNFKNVCKPNGVILLSAKSYGFNYHGYPHDFWRYELEDMENIFSDFEVLALERDSKEPGIFVKAKKPDVFTERDLSDYRLYSIVVNRREKELVDGDFRNFFFIRQVIKSQIKKFIFKMGSITYSKI